MADIIQLLPDSVANQIAAGEVIQRPASAVKELMENAIDAKATQIKLIVKDAGKTLIQVIDNGLGMSERDARMSFERHATSKIKKADDLFSIRTMGFRGEALASIAAIAQVELKTKRADDSLGTLIEIEGSVLKIQEPCACQNGTSFAIKNLFYNVPARRNFLKSDPAEFRYILEEFQRVALAFPEVAFSLNHNGNDVFQLPSSNLKQRIVGLFGNNYNERLVPVEEHTDILNISGFVIKPQFCKKTRGEQYFFVNNRFIKNAYLNHSVQSAFQHLISGDVFPSYFLKLEINPQTIDINIHPTKTEIKFEDERSIYMILQASIKRSLGIFNITPTIDFNREQSFDIAFDKNKPVVAPTIKVDKNYNPFKTTTGQNYQEKYSPAIKQNWQELYDVLKTKQQESSEPQQEIEINEGESPSQAPVFQLLRKYIVSSVKSGLLLIDQQAAHERIVFEKLQQTEANTNTQQLLYPEQMEVSTHEYQLINELKDDLNGLGFDIRDFGKNTFVIHGIPADAKNSKPAELLMDTIHQYEKNTDAISSSHREGLLIATAKSASIKKGRQLKEQEMLAIIDQLFACENTQLSPSGKKIYFILTEEELDKRFNY
ncbi:MAG: DNA mismatch repair endonuclease MutL [Bacteroidetes bacterium]|nr:DNA mismatch repair endonuclease MutL [Bacteroidota bacterium]